MSLAENVKKRRKEKKLTQEQLAEQAGVSRVYITKSIHYSNGNKCKKS